MPCLGALLLLAPPQAILDFRGSVEAKKNIENSTKNPLAAVSTSAGKKALHNTAEQKKRNVGEISFAQHPTNFPSSFFAESGTKPNPTFSVLFFFGIPNSSPLVASLLGLNEYLLLFYCICWIHSPVLGPNVNLRNLWIQVLIKLTYFVCSERTFTINFYLPKRIFITWLCERKLRKEVESKRILTPNWLDIWVISWFVLWGCR